MHELVSCSCSMGSDDPSVWTEDVHTGGDTHTTHVWTHPSVVKMRMSSTFTPMLSYTVGHLNIVIVDVYL